MISEDVLITIEDRTFVVDAIDATARQTIHANGGTIEAVTIPGRTPPFQSDRFRVIVPEGTTMSGADTIMAIQRLVFTSGDYIRVVPQEYIVELKEGRR